MPNMTVGIKLGNITDEIGGSDFFHAFFSTVSGNLERSGWGTRFPTIMHRLYQGKLHQEHATDALRELQATHAELSRLPVSKLIWDIEDRAKRPPWGDNIAQTITDLGNYFVTSTGRELFPLLREVLEELRDRGGVAEIVTC